MGIKKGREKFQNPIIIGGLFLLVGLVFGLVYSYLIDPVEWINVPFEQTREDIQEDYLRMALDQYTYTYDSLKLQDRWGNLGAAGPAILAQVIANPGNQTPDSIAHLQKTVFEKNAIPSSECLAVANEPTRNVGSSNFCIYLWVITILCGGVLVYHLNNKINHISQPHFTYDTQIKAVTQLQNKKSRTETPTISKKTIEKKVSPHSTFLASYQLGDDLYRESFSIETTPGEFLGECGIDVAHVINDGPPKQISAFDIWLFDKNEIETKSIVLVTDISYQNDETRSRLSTIGKPFKIEVGKKYKLHTNNILLEISILDVFYDCFTEVASNCIERLVVEFAVWTNDQ